MPHLVTPRIGRRERIDIVGGVAHYELVGRFARLCKELKGGVKYLDLRSKGRRCGVFLRLLTGFGIDVDGIYPARSPLEELQGDNPCPSKMRRPSTSGVQAPSNTPSVFTRMTSRVCCTVKCLNWK